MAKAMIAAKLQMRSRRTAALDNKVACKIDAGRKEFPQHRNRRSERDTRSRAGIPEDARRFARRSKSSSVPTVFEKQRKPQVLKRNL